VTVNRLHDKFDSLRSVDRSTVEVQLHLEALSPNVSEVMMRLVCVITGSYIIGEHGDSSVAVWSNVNVAGTRLKDLFPNAGETPYDYENWDHLHRDVVNAAYEIIRLKGYTSWSIGIMCAKLAEAILKNQVSTRFLAQISRPILQVS